MRAYLKYSNLFVDGMTAALKEEQETVEKDWFENKTWYVGFELLGGSIDMVKDISNEAISVAAIHLILFDILVA